MGRRNNKGLGRLVINNLHSLIQAIARAQKDPVSGAEKLDRAADWLNDRIDIGYVPEWLEKVIIKTALTTVVELSKALWVDTDWFTQLLRAADLEHLEGTL